MEKSIETRSNLCTEQWAAYDRVKLWGLLFTENSSRRKLSCTSHIDERRQFLEKKNQICRYAPSYKKITKAARLTLASDWAQNHDHRQALQ